FYLRAERVVHFAWFISARVERPGDEFPERIEVRELRFGRVVIMRRAIMHIGREPDDVFDSVSLDESQQFGQLDLAPQRRAIAVGESLEIGRAVFDHDPDGHVARYHLPPGL